MDWKKKKRYGGTYKIYADYIFRPNKMPAHKA